MGHSPVRSTNLNVRATARYDAVNKRVSIHIHNYATNADGTPAPQTTTLIWNWTRPTSLATVARLGESTDIIDLFGGATSVSLNEYAIVNFAVA